MNETESQIEAATKGRHYVITTDGSCRPNPGTGGWAAIIQLREGEQVLRQGAIAGQGPVMTSTNNQMEVTAAIRGLATVKDRSLPVIVQSDSQYVINTMTRDMARWKTNGWRNSEKKPVLNQDLWQGLDQEAEGRTVFWTKVVGHSGHSLNELTDHLAGQAAEGAFLKAVVRRLRPELFINNERVE